MNLVVQFLSMKLEVVNSDVSTGPKVGMFPSGEVSPKLLLILLKIVELT